MKEQKVIITDSQDTINDLISKGWEVVSITAQHVSISTTSAYSTKSIQGGFCFLLQR